MSETTPSKSSMTTSRSNNPSTEVSSPTSSSAGAAESDRLLGQFIPLHYHYQMLLDESRVAGFKESILRSVPTGGKVVELGGGTGILSFFAAQRASKVWCVERNPQMVEAARALLAKNGVSDRVEVVAADAMAYCPPEEVDAVICEMLHSALLREKQLQVIEAFKRNYRARFGKLPATFIPEATILAVQPVEQAFDFHGYQAPIPLFFEPHNRDTKTHALTDPLVYSMFEYRNDFPLEFKYDGSVKIAEGGTLNGLRFITKNVLSIDLQNNKTTDWHNFYMILPLVRPLTVKMGDRISIKFSYRAGDPIDTLTNSMQVAVVE